MIKYLLSAFNSAPGHDLIPGVAFRKLAHIIAHPITIIFQQSLFQSKFPTAWERAIIQPVYKRKGDKNSPSSYRPISLYCTMGKLLEKIVNDQLLSHINSVGLISDRQHGFTKNRSTVTNLLAADSILADWINDSVSYDILSFDFSRAFDSVPHDLLIEQLATYNLHSQSLKWFKSFLTSRSTSQSQGCIIQLHGGFIWNYTRFRSRTGTIQCISAAPSAYNKMSFSGICR